MDNPLIIFLSVLTGLAIGVVIMVIISKAGLNKDQQKANLLLKEAEAKADATVKQAVLDGRTQAHELKIAAEKEIKERKQEVTDMENKLLRREDNLNFRDETLTSKEKQIDVKSAQLADKMAMLDKKDKELQEKIAGRGAGACCFPDNCRSKRRTDGHHRKAYGKRNDGIY